MASNAFTYPVRVPYRGTDASGILHFSEMPHYFELCEHAFVRELGFAHDEFRPLDFPRASVTCDYFAPVFYNDVLDVELQVENLGNSSLTYQFVVRRDDTLVSEGRMTVVCVDEGGKSTPLPDRLRKAMEPYFAKN